MKRKGITGFWVVIILCFLLAGCTTTRWFYQKVVPEKAGLKKKVLVTSFINQADYGKERVEELTARFLGLLKKEDNFIVETSQSSLLLPDNSRSLRFGIVIDTDQAKRADEMGVNVFITVVLNPHEVSQKKTGIWPFRKFSREMEMSMVVNAFDVTNGTLFLTHLQSGRTSLPWIPFEEEVTKPEIDEKAFQKVWSEILDKQISTLVEVLKSQPWSGRIMSVQSDKVLIRAGKDIGVTAGSTFEVFGPGEAIRAEGGRPLHFLGAKIGEIKALEVMGDYSIAIPAEGSGFATGQIIRIKF